MLPQCLHGMTSPRIQCQRSDCEPGHNNCNLQTDWYRDVRLPSWLVNLIDALWTLYDSMKTCRTNAYSVTTNVMSGVDFKNFVMILETSSYKETPTRNLPERTLGRIGKATM